MLQALMSSMCRGAASWQLFDDTFRILANCVRLHRNDILELLLAHCNVCCRTCQGCSFSLLFSDTCGCLAASLLFSCKGLSTRVSLVTCIICIGPAHLSSGSFANTRVGLHSHLLMYAMYSFGLLHPFLGHAADISTWQMSVCC